MISTVTTSTVSTVALATLGGSISIVAILILLGLLVQKELAGSWMSDRASRLSRTLTIGIIPLLAAFLVVIGVRVAQVIK
jgi:putative effector of murein hydrolase LrgA (UPF0299 family)